MSVFVVVGWGVGRRVCVCVGVVGDRGVLTVPVRGFVSLSLAGF